MRAKSSNSGFYMAFTAEEREWFDQLCRTVGLKRQALARAAFITFCAARQLPCNLKADRGGKTYDRDDPNSGKAWKDRYQLFDRRANGESVREMAREYGISGPALYTYLQSVARERGESVGGAIGRVTSEACERVLADPFTNIGTRAREIASRLALGGTYQEIGDELGVSRQRIHQVAKLCRQEAGVTRAQSFRSALEANQQQGAGA